MPKKLAVEIGWVEIVHMHRPFICVLNFVKDPYAKLQSHLHGRGQKAVEFSHHSSQIHHSLSRAIGSTDSVLND